MFVRRAQKWDIGFEVAELIDRMPPVADMRQWVRAGRASSTAPGLEQRLDIIDGRLYPLVFG